MIKVYETVLNPAAAGFGEWDWVEKAEVEGAEEIGDWVSMCHDSQVSPVLTEELDGRIHNQRGQVYRLDHEPYPDGEPCQSYHMVWVEETDN